jgi:hypothetical protein
MGLGQSVFLATRITGSSYFRTRPADIDIDCEGLRTRAWQSDHALAELTADRSDSRVGLVSPLGTCRTTSRPRVMECAAALAVEPPSRVPEERR